MSVHVDEFTTAAEALHREQRTDLDRARAALAETVLDLTYHVGKVGLAADKGERAAESQAERDLFVQAGQACGAARRHLDELADAMKLVVRDLDMIRACAVSLEGDSDG